MVFHLTVYTALILSVYTNILLKKAQVCPPWRGMCLLHAPRGAKNAALHVSVWVNTCRLVDILRIKPALRLPISFAALARRCISSGGRPLQQARSLQDFFLPFGRRFLQVSCRRCLLASQPAPGQPWGRWGIFWLRPPGVLHVLIADLGGGRSWNVQNILRLTVRQLRILMC